MCVRKRTDSQFAHLCLRIENYAGKRRVSQNIILGEKITHLPNAPSNDNVKWYPWHFVLSRLAYVMCSRLQSISARVGADLHLLSLHILFALCLTRHLKPSNHWLTPYQLNGWLWEGGMSSYRFFAAECADSFLRHRRTFHSSASRDTRCGWNLCSSVNNQVTPC